MLFENICENTCGWKSALKCVKCCLKTENGCLKSQTKHPLNLQQNLKNKWVNQATSGFRFFYRDYKLLEDPLYIHNYI